MERITLSELNSRIQQVIRESLTGRFWVMAEIIELRINRNGHCYLELAQKNMDDEKIVARAQAIIFSFTLRTLKPYFESISGIPLSAGIKVLLNVSVDFHEVYGFSLQVHDIDPAYTAGDLALRKQEIIRRLQEEGVLDMNRQLTLPPVLQRIAVISSETAAGYGDFIHQLENNDYGLVFYPTLFPAVMQGDEAPASIILALDAVFCLEQHFDCVVIIRGGGAQSDLLCFNNYDLACHIAQFPLPVITGIGHERDDTVADHVAYLKQKTPTAVAGFLISHNNAFLSWLDDRSRLLSELTIRLIDKQRMLLNGFSNRCIMSGMKLMGAAQRILDARHRSVVFTARTMLQQHHHRLMLLPARLRSSATLRLSQGRSEISQQAAFLIKAVQYFFEAKEKSLQAAEKSLRLQDPAQILKKGYSITRHKGSVVRDASALNTGDILETEISNGKLFSQFIK